MTDEENYLKLEVLQSKEAAQVDKKRNIEFLAGTLVAVSCH